MSSPVVSTAAMNLHLRSGKTPLHILKDIDLSIEAGEVIAVVGPSGSGKTSLLMVLGGLEQASNGSVTVAGTAITGKSEDELAIFRRQNLGILFQNFHLIPSMTALENVALSLEIAETGQSFDNIAASAKAALTAVGLGDRLDHRPSALSGGEQQRVGLARAIVGKPKLLLADEPTGNLDQDTGARVIEMMFALARDNGTAVFLITHDPALARRADRILSMNHGRLTPMTESVPA
ncbi:ABC transporter ATP-binding protein [Devosia aurantiaca]|uniref:ABC transporter ATP-binding protein n=1 Tax=Devosia aurantiaca TaxID=2714858 RepID=A0A6M1T1R1_9HYPH|nr:ABC transporter ATP-binding protein [Devosia aurantiaca]NGP18781.1 ABC transporter ATP-binding protein [Devosia aurantiaca]